jgi:hypothetical protein
MQDIGIPGKIYHSPVSEMEAKSLFDNCQLGHKLLSRNGKKNLAHNAYTNQCFIA